MEACDHGGGCCGIKHILSFSSTEGQRNRESLRAYIEKYEGAQRGRLFEVVLTDAQLTGDAGPETLSALYDEGFRLVDRFNNSNSGNYCNIFHRHRLFVTLTEQNLPFEWPGETYVQTILISWREQLARIMVRRKLNSLWLNFGVSLATVSGLTYGVFQLVC